jgi:hypothetical protein
MGLRELGLDMPNRTLADKKPNRTNPIFTCQLGDIWISRTSSYRQLVCSNVDFLADYRGGN